MSSLITAAVDFVSVIGQATTPPSSGASKDSSLSQILLYVGGFAGIASAIVAILKLKPDANSQSVTQAQGAATEWNKLYAENKAELKEAERELAWWRDRTFVAEDLLRSHSITVPLMPALGPPPPPPSV